MKIGITLGIFFCSLLASSASYCAENDPTLEKMEPRLSALEKNEHYGKRYNPPATQASGLILGADVLYWQARENGIPYVVGVPNPLSDIGLPPFPHREVKKSHVKELEFDWDFGVRVHGGLQLHRDAWQILGTWTHFDTKGADHGFTKNLKTPIGSSKAYNPIWADPRFLNTQGLIVNFVSQARAKWRLLFNQADLMLSRAFYTGRYFIMEPAIGVSGIWIDQHLHTWYKRAVIPGSSHVKLKNDFKGIGIRGGLETRFCFWRGMALFNMTHLGLYYGKFELHRKELFQTDTLFPKTIYESTRNSYWQVSPAIDMQMGLRWDYSFKESRHAISAKLAYEYLIYFSQNQFLRIINLTPFAQIVENQGDLSLTGGTFSVMFTF